MSTSLFLALALGATVGGFVNGLAGFGFALFALGIWLPVLPPVQAVAITLILTLSGGLFGLWQVSTAIRGNPVRLMRFILPSLAGIPLGVMLLDRLNASVLTLMIAGFLITFGGFFSLRSTLPRFSHPTPLIDMTVGFIGGVLGGSTSLSGALPTMWCSLRGWPKAETRAVLQPYGMFTLGITAIVFAAKGLFDRETLTFIAIALPFNLIAAWIGIRVFRRLSDTQFLRLLVTLMLVSGVILVAREAF